MQTTASQWKCWHKSNAIGSGTGQCSKGRGCFKPILLKTLPSLNQLTDLNQFYTQICMWESIYTHLWYQTILNNFFSTVSHRPIGIRYIFLFLYLKLIQLICFRYTALRTHLTWNLHCFNTPHVHFVAKLERFWTSMGFPTMWLKSTLFWGSKWIGVNIRKFQSFWQKLKTAFR